MIATLQREYVACWLLAKDLPRIEGATDDPELQRLCRVVRENYKYPVDTVLITPNLEVVGHKNANEAMGESARDYVAFLRRGAALARGEPPPAETTEPPAADRHEHDPATETEFEPQSDLRKIVLTVARPTGTLLNVVTGKGGGQSPFSGFFEIDATACAGGGRLEIEVEVGGGKGAAVFELCSSTVDEQQNLMLMPVVKTPEVAPGGRAKIEHPLAEGAMLYLGVRGVGEKGATNAFRVRATLRGE